jgi:hypothetical protein
MPTSQGPILKALYTRIAAAMPAPIVTTLVAVGPYMAAEHVVVGVDSTDTQPYRTLGKSRKDEAIDISCGIWVEWGNDDFAERVDRAFAIRVLFEAAIAADMTLGMPGHANVRATVMSGQMIGQYGVDGGGTGVELTVVVHVDASVYNQGAVTP